jgi:hypothetical protein
MARATDFPTTNPSASDGADPDADRRNSLPNLISDMEQPIAHVRGLAQAMFKAAADDEGIEALAIALQRAGDDVKGLWQLAFELSHSKRPDPKTAIEAGEFVESFRRAFAGAKVSLDEDIVSLTGRQPDQESPIMLYGPTAQLMPFLRLLNLQAKS